MPLSKNIILLATALTFSFFYGCVKYDNVILSSPSTDGDATTVLITHPGRGTGIVKVLETGETFHSYGLAVNNNSTKNIEKIMEWNKTFQVVKTSFATNRKIQKNGKITTYTADPGDLTYGFCYVSIPKDHVMGEIESPSFWKLEFTPNPEKHIVIMNTEQASRQIFFDEIRKNIKTSKKSNALVFIHGFNVTFDEAAQRTAQMAYDLQFDGVPVFFSWPSRGTAPSYTVDERNIEWAEADIKAFLVDFLKNSQADNVYVIGHSMGTRALTRSLAAIGVEDPKALRRLKGVILAAPDIDAIVFKRDIAPKLIGTNRNITLYASSNDRALLASKKIHGYQRAGETGKALVIVPGMDTIDASQLDTSLVGHSYYGDNRSIISDMYYMLKAQLPPSQRSGLSPVGKAPNSYWLFRP